MTLAPFYNTYLQRMASIRKSLAALSADLQLFAPQVSSEVTELRRNVEVCPVTGATLYRHCLEDLNDRLASLGEDVESLEAVSLDAISLEVRMHSVEGTLGALYLVLPSSNLKSHRFAGTRGSLHHSLRAERQGHRGVGVPPAILRLYSRARPHCATEPLRPLGSGHNPGTRSRHRRPALSRERRSEPRGGSSEPLSLWCPMLTAPPHRR